MFIITIFNSTVLEKTFGRRLEEKLSGEWKYMAKWTNPFTLTTCQKKLKKHLP